MNTVTLRNGSKEVEPLVRETSLALRRLADEHPFALYELVMKCRDSSHELFGDTGDILKQRRLLEPSGKVHSSIANIVLSSVEGDGFEMSLRSPVKE